MTKQEAIDCMKLAYMGYRDFDHEAYDIAIECIEECIKHEETFEWCTDCKEYDQENHCCHRWSKCIRKTAKELEEFYKLESKGLVPQTTVIG